MTSTFPFQVAYDHIAHQLLMKGLPHHGILVPTATILFVENDSVYRSTPVPGAEKFFESEAGVAFMGQHISSWVKTPQESATKDFCMVIAVESYMQMTDMVKSATPHEAVKKARAQLPDTLAGHPDSSEVVAITVHHRSGTRIGALPISDNRSLTYQPLFSRGETFGRLTPNDASSG